MKRILGLGLILMVVLGITACSNTLSKEYGGTMKLELEPNQKLVNITWKDTELWYLTRPMKENEEAETLTFQEKNNTGLMEGKVIIIESKNK